MKISRIQIMGFQCFEDSGPICFSHGINLVVGQNNSGKSAVLRALNYNLSDDGHRNPESYETHLVQHPRIYVDLSVSGHEFTDSLKRLSGTHYIPVPRPDDTGDHIERILSLDEYSIRLLRRPGSFATKYPGHGLFEHIKGQQKYAAKIRSEQGSLTSTIEPNQNDNVDNIVRNIWSRKLFSFNAERMKIGRCGLGNSSILDPGAENLPAVLATISTERPGLFSRLIDHVNDIFSTVGYVTSGVMADQNQVEIRIWPARNMEHPELSFPLDQSGTGISQVLAILAAVMTLDDAVIVIDEINSFLHPSAVKSLLRILQTFYTSHQYIISTHSPEVISFSNASTIHIIKRDGYKSFSRNLKLTDVSDLRDVASHIGVSMSDIFGSDRIIWVEGTTEEICFPLIYNHSTSKPVPIGVNFSSVLATGDFMTKRKDRTLVYKIYQRLSQAAQPLLVSVVFSFDSETYSDSEKSDMNRDSNGRMHFLPRRHFECYLLDARSIARFITRKAPSLEPDISESDVISTMERLALTTFAIAEYKGDLADPVWQSRVDAAKLISMTCAEVTDHRVTFDKTGDSLALLQEVIETNPEQIEELASYVRSLVEAVTAGNAASPAPIAERAASPSPRE